MPHSTRKSRSTSARRSMLPARLCCTSHPAPLLRRASASASKERRRWRADDERLATVGARHLRPCHPAALVIQREWRRRRASQLHRVQAPVSYCCSARAQAELAGTRLRWPLALRHSSMPSTALRRAAFGQLEVLAVAVPPQRGCSSAAIVPAWHRRARPRAAGRDAQPIAHGRDLQLARRTAILLIQRRWRGALRTAARPPAFGTPPAVITMQRRTRPSC